MPQGDGGRKGKRKKRRKKSSPVGVAPVPSLPDDDLVSMTSPVAGREAFKGVEPTVVDEVVSSPRKKKKKKKKPAMVLPTPMKPAADVDLVSPSTQDEEGQQASSTPGSPLSPVETLDADLAEWGVVVSEQDFARRRRSRSMITSFEESDASSGPSEPANAFRAWSKLHTSSSQAMFLTPDGLVTPLTSPVATFAVRKQVAAQMDWLHKGGLRKRSQSTGELPSETYANPTAAVYRRTFFGEYSDETRHMLRQRNNSHFLPSSTAPNEGQESRTWLVLRYISNIIKAVITLAAVYFSFYDIKFITRWNPYLKVAHYSGRMLVPLLDTWVGAGAADWSLWMGGQIGFYRALGRLSGGYRKFEEGWVTPASEDPFEVGLYYSHWVLDFLYFPTEHLGLIEWEVFGYIGSKLIFTQINAVVWYWRQVLQLLLLFHAVSNDTFSVSAFALSLYSLNLLVDMLTAYAFLAPYTPPTSVLHYPYSLLCTRRFNIGLGAHGLLGVADGVIQIVLRYQYS